MIKIIILATTIIVQTFAITSLELAKKVDKLSDGFVSSQSVMTMTLINAREQKTIRKMQTSSLEGNSGDKSLMMFLTPADVKGTKMLTHENINGDDDQWMFLPALKRVKRIASRNKSGSFMGSEFSYEDTANNSYEKYTYNDDIKEVQLDGVKHYTSTRIPKDKNSGYTKQITWVNAKTFLVKKIDYYDRKKELIKTAIFDEYKNINGISRTVQITMTNHQNRKMTILSWDDDKINVGLKDKDFSKRKLKR